MTWNILLIWFCAVICIQANAADVPKKVVEVERVKLGDIAEVVKLTGRVRSSAHANLIAKDAGIIAKIYSSPSEYVSKNTLVATLKNHGVAVAKEAIIRKEFARTLKLNQQHIASDTSLDIIRKELLEQQQNLEHSAFYAPFDGYVGVFKAKEGEEIKQGQVLVSIYNKDQLYLSFDLAEHLVNQVQLGQSVLVNGHHEKIIAVQYAIDHDTQLAPAESSLHCKECVIGSLIDLELVLSSKAQTMIIPYQAVIFKQGLPVVYLVDKLGKVVEKSIKLGIKNKDQVEVIGLNLGDLVVLKGHARISDGEQVTIHQAAEKK